MAEKKQPPSGHIHIEGDVGPGAAIGPGAEVEAENIAGRDIIIHGQPVSKTLEEFTRRIEALEALVNQAIEAGEIPAGRDADDAVEQLRQATEMSKDEKPPKNRILRRLEDVKEILENAVEAARPIGAVAARAIPVATALIELARALF